MRMYIYSILPITPERYIELLKLIHECQLGKEIISYPLLNKPLDSTLENSIESGTWYLFVEAISKGKKR